MQGILKYEDTVIGDDVNGHVGSDKVEYEIMHIGYGCEEKNKTGEKVLNFELSYELTIINKYFRKKRVFLKL